MNPADHLLIKDSMKPKRFLSAENDSSGSNYSTRLPGSSFLLLLLLMAGGLLHPAYGQAPALLWTNNIGGQIFAVDDQTNVYANAGGTVTQLHGNGVPFATNSICPIPGHARRDLVGNYYFAGSFDGTQNFGGVTLVGGWTNWPMPGKWSPGWPTCFVAKYASNGALQWVNSFGTQAQINNLSDLLVDEAGRTFACYAN